MTPRAPASVATGTAIGPYEIVGWLGAGGMGDVYRARDPRLGREVAIKLLPETFAADALRLHRFEQEARAAGQLNHPNILAVYDVGTHAGAPYIVSELLEGESLRRRLQAGPLPSRKAIDYARQTAEGLAAAHDKGIVHRDLKPDNLFITSDGRVKILDFGIAKLTRPGDDTARDAGVSTETELGMVVGTAGYMSPEQVRGEIVDHRSDLFSFGTILYEMLAGRSAFTRETTAETMAAILKEDPPAPLPAIVPVALERILSRCLEKTREMRFQSARDLAFGLEVLSGTSATATPAAVAAAPRRWRTALGIAIVALSLAAAVAGWLTRGQAPPPTVENPLANAQFTRFTNFPGSEVDAALSPDGRFVSFLADRDGPFHVWLSQVGSGRFVDLTPGKLDERNNAGARNAGFSADGSDIWLSGNPRDGRRLRLMPFTGGAPRVFLNEHAQSMAWSPDATRVAYFAFDDGDPIFVADRTGGNARQIFVSRKGEHNHFPTWSPDGQWIYYVHSVQTINKGIWRIPSAGGTSERMTGHDDIEAAYPTPIDARTMLYVARAEDQSGPWLWALDVERRIARRASVGLEKYLSVAASADGRRLVATVANPTANLWSVPILDRLAEERDVTAYPMPGVIRALAPRFGGTSLFYLSSRGTGDGLWRFEDGQASEIWKGSDGALQEPPGVSPDGRRAAIALRKDGKASLTVVSADGSEHRSLAEGIEVLGTAAWSPDGKWIVMSGNDAERHPGLFKIPIDGGAPVRLVAGENRDPVWSPDGRVIVYGGSAVASTRPLLAARPDGSPVSIPTIRVMSSGAATARYRFLPTGKGLVFMQGPAVTSKDFWLLDLTTNASRQLTRLSDPATMGTFDITPDGKQIVFDRMKDNSDIVLIDRPK